MIIMGIDSSSPQSSVALLKDGLILNQAETETTSKLSNNILSLMDKVLTESSTKLEDLDCLCLTIGPGSFTGLRVGTSLIKGLVLATSKPFVKIDTLEATALSIMPNPGRICAILDAKKNEVYTACFQSKNGSLERLTPDRAITPYQLCEETKVPTIFVGSGMATYGRLLSPRIGKNFLSLHKKTPLSLAASATRLAEIKFKTNKCLNTNELNIKYVRKPEAELKFEQLKGISKGEL